MLDYLFEKCWKRSDEEFIFDAFFYSGKIEKLNC